MSHSVCPISLLCHTRSLSILSLSRSLSLTMSHLVSIHTTPSLLFTTRFHPVAVSTRSFSPHFIVSLSALPVAIAPTLYNSVSLVTTPPAQLTSYNSSLLPYFVHLGTVPAATRIAPLVFHFSSTTRSSLLPLATCLVLLRPLYQSIFSTFYLIFSHFFGPGQLIKIFFQVHLS